MLCSLPLIPYSSSFYAQFLQSALSDVAALMHVFEGYVRRSFVGTLHSFLQGCAVSGYAENATASGDELVIFGGGSSMKNLDAFDVVGLFYPQNRVARCVIPWIASRRNTQADSVARMP